MLKSKDNKIETILHQYRDRAENQLTSGIMIKLLTGKHKIRNFR
jgi:hypothetical protein